MAGDAPAAVPGELAEGGSRPVNEDGCCCGALVLGRAFLPLDDRPDDDDDDTPRVILSLCHAQAAAPGPSAGNDSSFPASQLVTLGLWGRGPVVSCVMRRNYANNGVQLVLRRFSAGVGKCSVLATAKPILLAQPQSLATGRSLTSANVLPGVGSALANGPYLYLQAR